MSEREPFFKPYFSEWLVQQFFAGRLVLAGLLVFGVAVWWAL